MLVITTSNWIVDSTVSIVDSRTTPKTAGIYFQFGIWKCYKLTEDENIIVLLV